ncbi:uncharacterized protein LOC111374396 isoform X3 [Olea europaea var. sylvestris]|uniref:uncharacterized protein LOC111374396 isoform X3 n=1 Tax=Olea europaea var. sylvestris TaxID=158386 RepID=UPI000C1D22F8|nr:uncharacterized protein LOC111374396 isoform X3 [Olea europaea var. sylvestris]
MVELSSVSSLTPIAPSQDASEPKQNSATLYGVVQPSFSYLNVNNPPSRSSQQSSASPHPLPLILRWYIEQKMKDCKRRKSKKRRKRKGEGYVCRSGLVCGVWSFTRWKRFGVQD